VELGFHPSLYQLKKMGLHVTIFFIS
jgi:hypothetical protein